MKHTSNIFRYIPLGVAGALLRVALLATVTVLARIVLKEQVTVAKVVSLILSLVAVILVIQPSFIFGTTQSSKESNNTLTEKIE